MATYFPGSDNQNDASRKLYSKEHLPASYSYEPTRPGNGMIYMDFASTSGAYSDALACNSQQPNRCTDGDPVSEPDSSHSEQVILSNLGGSRVGLDDFGAWKNGRTEMLMGPAGGASDVVLQGSQTLSLSLGTNVSPGFQMSPTQYSNLNNSGVSTVLGSNQLFTSEGSGRDGSFAVNDDYHSKQLRNAEYSPSGFPGSSSDGKVHISPYGMASIMRTFSNSKYLKVAQLLLDEVVHLRAAMKRCNSRTELMKDAKEVDRSLKDDALDSPENGEASNPQDTNRNHKSELPTAVKLELQGKLAKLLSMLDEVDSRYKQYYHQMQIVVSSFDVFAGSGAAKPYTAVALQTISCHFRCLRDAIKDQILGTRKSLGEQDASANGKGIRISRLRHVDQQLRQQRALQQLGVMQQHTWRPQRGLPENAVSILRAWLFEHFLHPYPKDSDKSILARQTGLTRSQVSNWFINARVRLWKPMVEEMYKEELGDGEMESTSSADVVSKATKSDQNVSEDRGEDVHLSSTSAPTQQLSETRSNASFQNVMNSEIQTRRDLAKARKDQRTTLDGCTTFREAISHASGVSDRFMAAATNAYHISQLERFGNGEEVSLTLRLQHCDESSLPMSLGAHQSFVTMRGDHGFNTAPSSTDFDGLDSGSSQLRFGSSQLYHDFVA